MTSEDRQTALLVRVWFEDGPETFRARLTALLADEQGPAPHGVTVATVASPRDVLSAVREWLDGVLRSQGDTGGFVPDT
jgi:hypothetical protein